MQRRRQRKKLRTDRLIFLFIITTIIVTILTLAKYKSTIATEESSIKVAFPAIDLLSDEVLDVDINPTTREKEFIFAVANTEGEKRTQVSMKYTIQINTLSNLPLEFELYTYEDSVKGEHDLLNGNGSITDYIEFDSLDSDLQDMYMLIIKWKEGQTDYRYNHTIDYVQIVINGVQVD